MRSFVEGAGRCRMWRFNNVQSRLPLVLVDSWWIRSMYLLKRKEIPGVRFRLHYPSRASHKSWFLVGFACVHSTPPLRFEVCETWPRGFMSLWMTWNYEETGSVGMLQVSSRCFFLSKQFLLRVCVLSLQIRISEIAMLFAAGALFFWRGILSAWRPAFWFVEIRLYHKHSLKSR